MKIGIITFHRPINYGAYLQCYSLVSKLQKEYSNSQVEVIDYMAPKERKKILINLLRTLKHSGIINTLKEIALIKQFRRSLKYLPLTKERFCSNNLQKLYKYIDNNFDLLVIGSDAVFNWNQNGYPSAFLPNYEFKKCKIVSYAASVHGLKYYDASKDIIDEISNVFSKFEVIGVRDKNTENFVKYAAENLIPIHCCDPTFFIDCDVALKLASDFKLRILKKYNVDLSRKYIVIMLADGEINKAIREEFKDDYTILSLFKNSKYSDTFLYDLNPFEWMGVLANASIVITSYFHGTLLSLKQTTPVITIDCSNYNYDNYEGKLNDLYNRRLNMPYLYFDNSKYSDEMKKEIIETVRQAISGKYNVSIQTSVEKESGEINKFIDVLNSKIRMK